MGPKTGDDGCFRAPVGPETVPDAVQAGRVGSPEAGRELVGDPNGHLERDQWAR